MKTLIPYLPFTSVLRVALCQQQPGLLSVALCFELPGDGSVPDWVPMIPVGDVVGRDGRAWSNPNPEQVIANTLASGRQQPLDWEHSTQHQAPKGKPAPAAAWFTEYRVNNGFIEGRLEFTAAGKASVANREYRYISPVFRFDANNIIWDIESAGLTNRPNLLLPALNQQQPTQPNQETAMDLEKLMAALRAKLGLPAEATPETALNSIQQLQGNLQTALNQAQTPSLDKFVPRPDYDQALARATNAEQALASKTRADKDAQVEKLVGDAVQAGKITPASKDFYVAACNAEGGVERFTQFIAAAPVIAGATGLDNKQPGQATPALNAEMQTMANFFGNTVEDLQQYGGLKAQ